MNEIAKTDDQDPVLLEDRLLAFFDVLGFSAKLVERGERGLHSTYANLIDEVRKTVFSSTQHSAGGETAPRANFDRAYLFSDSIVLVSGPLTDGGHPAIFHFIGSCSLLLEKSFEAGLPLRGCIGRGDFLDDPQRNIFLSSAFPRIVKTEGVQEWSGCALLPEAADVVLGSLFSSDPERLMQSPVRDQLLVHYCVPTKSGEHAGWCLNWPFFVNRAAVAPVLEEMTEPKRRNTAAFVEYVLRLPTEQEQPLSEEFHPAVRLLVQVTTGGMRMKFSDADGAGVDPPAGTSVELAFKRVQAKE